MPHPSPHTARTAGANWPSPFTGRRQERGAAGLARANHRGLYHTPTLSTRLPHIYAGGHEFEEWEAGEVGGKGLGYQCRRRIIGPGGTYSSPMGCAQP